MAKSGRLRAASWTPTTFSTALPAIATTTSPANASLIPSASVAGLSAVTNQSLTNAAATPAPPSTATVVESGQRGGAPPRRPRRRGNRQRHEEEHEQHPGADEAQRPLVRGRRRMERVRKRREREDRRREHAQRRDHPRAQRVESLRPVSDAADEKREAEHEHAVRDDRADERRLHDADQAVAQREQRDEQLGQVPERRLDDAGDRRAEPAAELLRCAADEAREHRDRQRGDEERRTGVASA